MIITLHELFQYDFDRCGFASENNKLEILTEGSEDSHLALKFHTDSFKVDVVAGKSSIFLFNWMPKDDAIKLAKAILNYYKIS